MPKTHITIVAVNDRSFHEIIDQVRAIQTTDGHRPEVFIKTMDDAGVIEISRSVPAVTGPVPSMENGGQAILDHLFADGQVHARNDVIEVLIRRGFKKPTATYHVKTALTNKRIISIGRGLYRRSKGAASE